MKSREELRQILESDRTVERLATIEHERWAHWQQYVHDHCERREDGSLVIPAELAERWKVQIETPYADLSDDEQESDREQVRKYLPVIIDAIS